MEERVGVYSLPSNQNNSSVFAIARYPALVNNGAVAESQQNLVEVNARGSMFKKRNFYRNVSIVLIIGIIGLIIGIVILSCYYFKIRKYNPTCTSEECIRSAANLKASMDLSVDPCDDFYQFTCGKWSEEHINHGWYSKFSGFETIDEHVSMKALKFLQSKVNASEPLPVKQTRDFYKACMDVDSIDKLGYSVLIKYLEEAGLPVVPNFFVIPEANASNFQFDWIKADVNVKKIFAMDLFVQFVIDADIYNRSINVMYLGATRSKSPLPSPFKSKSVISRHHHKKTRRKKRQAEEDEEEPSKEYQEAYKKVVKEVITVIMSNATKPPSDVQLEKAAEIIWNMTTEIAKMENAVDYESDYYLSMSKMTVTELQNFTDQLFLNEREKPVVVWKRYLTLLFDGIPNVRLDLEKKDFIHYLPEELEYLTGIVLYLTKIPDLFVELYAWWVIVNAMIVNTTVEIAEYIYKISSAFDSDTTIRTRSISCVGLTVEFMGVAVSYGIADSLFTPETKMKVNEMIERIKYAFLERLMSIDWMDSKTKDETVFKCMTMISFVGFPDWLSNKSAIEEYYSNITVRNNTYLENMMSVVKQYIPYRLASLREENERTWRTDPTTTNAFNIFADNAINIPMAILSYPLYHLGLEALNYGAIGTILGHELTHGFDNTGRKFDKFGNFVQWWSNKTIESFENRTQCFISQYSNYTLRNLGVNINGEKTLGENLADNGGLHHAFLAYTHYKEMYGLEEYLPGFENYTSDQLFFIAFGSVWCETRSSELLLEQIEYDEHCPNGVRVLGTLQNSHEFASAYNCPLGSPMNPKRERCRIW